jgi:hypothetical protein
MEKFEGVLTKLGNATVNKNAYKYSVIEIGGQIIQNKYISNGLQNYLQEGLTSGLPTTLWIRGKIIVGVKVEGGGAYFSRYKLGVNDWIILLISVPLMFVIIGFLGVALFIGKLIGVFFLNSAISKISAQNKKYISAVG